MVGRWCITAFVCPILYFLRFHSRSNPDPLTIYLSLPDYISNGNPRFSIGACVRKPMDGMGDLLFGDHDTAVVGHADDD